MDSWEVALLTDSAVADKEPALSVVTAVASAVSAVVWAMAGVASQEAEALAATAAAYSEVDVAA